LHTNPPKGLTAYYENNVIGGPCAFVFEAQAFEAFGQLLIGKLIKAIADAQGGFQASAVISPRDITPSGRGIANPVTRSELTKSPKRSDKPTSANTRGILATRTIMAMPSDSSSCQPARPSSVIGV
jgi:Protein of unknown function (DUF1194)